MHVKQVHVRYFLNNDNLSLTASNFQVWLMQVWLQYKQCYKVKLYRGSTKYEPQCAFTATHPITNSEQKTMSDAVARGTARDARCRGHLAAAAHRANGLWRWAPTTPRLHRRQRDLTEGYLTRIRWVASCLRGRRRSQGRVSGGTVLAVCLHRWCQPRGRVSLPPLDSLESSLDMNLQVRVSSIIA